jgi:hypothetical protein
MFQDFGLRSLTSEQARYRMSGKLGDGWDTEDGMPIASCITVEAISGPDAVAGGGSQRSPCFSSLSNQPVFSFPFPGLVNAGTVLASRLFPRLACTGRHRRSTVVQTFPSAT